MVDLTALEPKWRRVASTHTLQDLLHADEPPTQYQRITALLWASMLLLGGLAFLVSTVCLPAVLLVPYLRHWVFVPSQFQLLLYLSLLPTTFAAVRGELVALQDLLGCTVVPASSRDVVTKVSAEGPCNLVTADYH